MQLMAVTRRKTYASSFPGETYTKTSDIESGTKVTLIGIKKIGMSTYYMIHGGDYIPAKDLLIQRDLEYYNENIGSRSLMRNNLNMVGAPGLISVMDKYGEDDLTPTYDFLQMFANSFVSSRNDPMDGFPVGGGIIGNRPAPIGNIGGYSGDVSSTSVGETLGVSGDSTVGRLLNGVTFGDVASGNLMNSLLNNIADMLAGWLDNKLSYVIGFSFSSFLSNQWMRFGNDFWRAMGSSNRVPSATVGNRTTETPLWKRADEVQSSLRRSGYGVHYFQVYSDTPYTTVTWDYSASNARMKKYFEYKGSPTIIKRLGHLMWEEPETYLTTTLSGTEKREDRDYITNNVVYNDVQTYSNIYNADYKEFGDALTVIRDEFNINTDRMTIFTKFNRFRVPTPDNELSGSRGHIFFTRPNLNLSMEGRGDNVAGQDVVGQNMGSDMGNVFGTREIGETKMGGAKMTPLATNMLRQHSVLTSYLQGSAGKGDHDFIPILTHACTGIDVQDEVVETIDTGETYTGWKTTYGTSMIKSKTNGTVNVNFTDDDMLSVYKIIKLWAEYINAVWRGEAYANEEYRAMHILDYAISIYYILTKRTGHDILFWTKWTGCFPITVPSSNFSDSIGNQIRRPNYTVSFAYNRKDDFNPFNIIEFNNLSRGDFSHIGIYNPDSLRVHKSFVGAPFVDTQDGEHLYLLKFRPE